MVLFTTGLGTPTGNPIAPVMKVATTNSAMAARMSDIIDVDAGAIISGDSTVRANRGVNSRHGARSGRRKATDEGGTHRAERLYPLEARHLALALRVWSLMFRVFDRRVFDAFAFA